MPMPGMGGSPGAAGSFPALAVVLALFMQGSQRRDSLQIQPPVHFTAVPDHRNGDHTGVVVHVVDDPVVTHPYSQPWPVAL
jgi:hypothetical protein